MWRKRPGVEFGWQWQFGQVLVVSCHGPTVPCVPTVPSPSHSSPNTFPSPQRMQQWKIHVAVLTATTRIGSGAKSPFLSASKAAFGKQEPQFSSSSSFIAESV